MHERWIASGTLLGMALALGCSGGESSEEKEEKTSASAEEKFSIGSALQECTENWKAFVSTACNVASVDCYGMELASYYLEGHPNQPFVRTEGSDGNDWAGYLKLNGPLRDAVQRWAATKILSNRYIAQGMLSCEDGGTTCSAAYDCAISEALDRVYLAGFDNYLTGYGLLNGVAVQITGTARGTLTSVSGADGITTTTWDETLNLTVTITDRFQSNGSFKDQCAVALANGVAWAINAGAEGQVTLTPTDFDERFTFSTVIVDHEVTSSDPSASTEVTRYGWPY